MTVVASETGGEPILSPKQTAERLGRMQDEKPYTVTFRDPYAGDNRPHRVALTTTKLGVTLEYRRGYRTPSEEEHVLDGVVVLLAGAASPANPLEATAAFSGAVGEDGRKLRRLSVRYAPLAERGLEGQTERQLQLVAVGEDGRGGRTDPLQWNGRAERAGEAGAPFEAAIDLNVPPGPFTWSVAVCDTPTGLVSFLLVKDGR